MRIMNYRVAGVIGAAWAAAVANGQCASFSFECYTRHPSQWTIPFVRDNDLTRSRSFFGGDPTWQVMSGHVDYVRGDWAGSDGPSSVEIGGRGETGHLAIELGIREHSMTVCGHFDVSVNPDLYGLDAGPHRIRMAVNDQTLEFEYDAHVLQPSRADMKWVSVPFTFFLGSGAPSISFYTVQPTQAGVVIDRISLDEFVLGDVQAPVPSECQGSTLIRERSIPLPEGARVEWQIEDGFDEGGYRWRRIAEGDVVVDLNWGVEFRVEEATADRMVLSDVRAIYGPNGRQSVWTRCAVITGCGTRGEWFNIQVRFSEFNGDGFVDFFDFDAYVQCYEVEVCPPGRTADTNEDGFVDFFDYDMFVFAFENGL